MPSNPLTYDEIASYGANQNYPPGTFFASNPLLPSGIGWYDFESYLTSLGVPTSETIDVIKLDLKLTNQLNRYKEFIYNGSGDLITIKIWNSSSKTIQFYNQSFTYTLGTLTKITTLRNSDNFSYDTNFIYDINGVLTGINIIQTPIIPD